MITPDQILNGAVFQCGQPWCWTFVVQWINQDFYLLLSEPETSRWGGTCMLAFGGMFYNGRKEVCNTLNQFHAIPIKAELRLHVESTATPVSEGVYVSEDLELIRQSEFKRGFNEGRKLVVTEGASELWQVLVMLKRELDAHETKPDKLELSRSAWNETVRRAKAVYAPITATPDSDG